MRPVTTFLILFFIASVSFGQIKFEKGYFIDRDNQRIECLIKNLDWKDNPKEFSFKRNESAKPEKVNLNIIREFGINDCCRFIYANVKIDRSTTPIPGVKDQTASVFTRENLFLKVLLEGKASLYGYTDGKIQRFFYTLNDTVVTPLIYKEVHNGEEILKNTDFRQQLWEKLKNPNYSQDQIKRINYTLVELKAFFRSYNESLGVTAKEQVSQKKKSYFNLKITPGMNSSSASLTAVERKQRPQLSFGSNQSFRIGLEAELILPINNYRWGILFEPAFQAYKADAGGDNAIASLSYQSVEFPVGLRYHFYLNDDSRVFLNGFYVPGFGINMNSELDYDFINPEPESIPEGPVTLKISPSGNLAFGAGFEYKQFSLEARYYAKKEILSVPRIESSEYNRFSVILGYKFMQAKLK